MRRRYSVEYWTWWNGSASPQHVKRYRSLRCAMRAADRLARKHIEGRYVGWERYQAFVVVALGRETVYEPIVERAQSCGRKGSVVAMSKKSEAEERRNDSRAALLELLKPGTTVRTVLRHCSRSGMMREISLVTVSDGEARDITWHAANVLGDKLGKREGIRVPGCGMDMGFHLVYSLSSVLYPDGFECIGRSPSRCPSSEHSNGDRCYSPHMHASGGYALKQAWL